VYVLHVARSLPERTNRQTDKRTRREEENSSIEHPSIHSPVEIDPSPSVAPDRVTVLFVLCVCCVCMGNRRRVYKTYMGVNVCTLCRCALRLSRAHCTHSMAAQSCHAGGALVCLTCVCPLTVGESAAVCVWAKRSLSGSQRRSVFLSGCPCACRL